MNAGFFENLLLSTVLTVIILGVSNIAGDLLVQPIGETAPKMTAVAPDAHKPAAPVSAVAEVPFATLLASADAAAGKKLYSKCKSCHTNDKGGKNRVGPNLWNIVGKAKASADGFKYSDALKGLGGDWSFADLNGFLDNPKAYAKGTKMSFSGLRKAADRAALLVYLHNQSDSPIALP